MDDYAEDKPSATETIVNDSEDGSSCEKNAKRKASGMKDGEGGNLGPKEKLPQRLMELLQSGSAKDALWWLPGGTAFAIEPDKFSSSVLDSYFQGIKYESFIRNLRRWGFKRLPGRGAFSDVAAYHHHLFHKDSPHLVKRMYRRVGCGKARKAESEPTTSSVNTLQRKRLASTSHGNQAPHSAVAERADHSVLQLMLAQKQQHYEQQQQHEQQQQLRQQQLQQALIECDMMSDGAEGRRSGPNATESLKIEQPLMHSIIAQRQQQYLQQQVQQLRLQMLAVSPIVTSAEILAHHQAIQLSQSIAMAERLTQQRWLLDVGLQLREGENKQERRAKGDGTGKWEGSAK